MQELPLAELCHRCREEIQRFRTGAIHDDRFCFEVLRRAVVGRDHPAWQQLHEIYGSQVAAWCRRAAGPTDDVDDLVALTWEKFWHSYTAAKMVAASGTGEPLRYLQMCARSTVIDLARRRSGAIPIDAVAEPADRTPTPDEAYVDVASRSALWRAVAQSLRDERERVLIVMTYELGLRSAEIQAKRPDLFPSVHDVYRVTRNVLDRLRRSDELRAWLDSQKE